MLPENCCNTSSAASARRTTHPPSWATSPGTAVWRPVLAAIISRAAQQYANAMAHYVSPTPASLLFDAQCAQEPPTQSPSATGTYSLAQPWQTTQLGEQASLPRLHSLRGFFGPDDDADITLDLTTLSPASGSTPDSAPPDPQLGATPHGSPDTMQVDDTPATRNTGGEGPLSTENQTAPNMEHGSRLPRVMRLPQGAVENGIVRI